MRLVELFCMTAAFELLLKPNPWPGALRPLVVPEDPLYGWQSLLVTCEVMAVTLGARFFLGRNWSGTVTVKENHELIRGLAVSPRLRRVDRPGGPSHSHVLPILVFGWKYKLTWSRASRPGSSVNYTSSISAK